MNCMNPTTLVSSAMLAFALLTVWVPAFAQPVFKSTMPDGSIVYGEKPASGAARVETLELPPPKTGISGLTAEEKARAEQYARERAAAGAAAAVSQRRVDELRKQLREAEAAREAGKEPLPAERAGIAGGGSRLTEAYHARQKRLDDAVLEARKQLSEAERAAR
jgi:hypothetical protein